MQDARKPIKRNRRSFREMLLDACSDVPHHRPTRDDLRDRLPNLTDVQFEATLQATLEDPHTASNPNGRLAPNAANSDALAELAAHLTRAGVGFVRAIGVSGDGSHAEDSLLTWTLTTEDARFLGRRFSQDAVFEIDADNVRVVSCIDDETRARPRKHSTSVGSGEA